MAATSLISQSCCCSALPPESENHHTVMTLTLTLIHFSVNTVFFKQNSSFQPFYLYKTSSCHIHTILL
jgi:hypothetical protein